MSDVTVMKEGVSSVSAFISVKHLQGTLWLVTNTVIICDDSNSAVSGIYFSM